MKRPFLSLILFVAIGIQAGAQINITSSAVPFLRISPDARAGGMGNLGLATSADAGSIFYNRAKLPFADTRTSIGLSYSPWMRAVTNGMYLLSGSFYQQLNENRVLSAGIRYFNMGDVPMADYSGNKLPTAQPRELAADLGYAQKLSNTLAISVALRYIHSKLATDSMNGVDYKAGNAVAGDLSLYYNNVDSTTGGWSAGLALSNLGSKIGYSNDAAQKEFLPANFGIGVAYTKVLDEDNQIMVGIDYNHLLVPTAPADAVAMNAYYSKAVMESWFSSFNNKQNTTGIGAEYTYHHQFSVRAGYLIVPKDAGDNGGFTCGLGLKYTVLELHFSYLAASGNGVSRNPVSNTLRFGINFNSGK